MPGHSSFSHQHRGFTLIELLVVLMVMSLVLSLVGPAIQKVYAQHMAQQEMRLLFQYVRNASTFAYAQNETVLLTVQNNHIVAQPKRAAGQYRQEETSFDASSVNNNGSSDGSNNDLSTKAEAQLLAQAGFGSGDFTESDALENDPAQQLLFEHHFDYLTLLPATFEALPSGYITLDSLQVSIGSGEITKDVALKGLRFTEWFQG